MIIQNFQATDVPAMLSHASKEALVCAWEGWHPLMETENPDRFQSIGRSEFPFP